MHRSLAALALLTCLGTSAYPQDRRAYQRAVQDLRTFFTTASAEEGVVGSSLVVLRGDSASWAVQGMADLATQRPVDSATIYHWASITKTFTAIAIMQLRDRGLLTLDDPILKYVPELAAVHNPFGPMEAITLRQLLSHSAGFRNPTWPWGGDQPWHPFEPTEWSQLVAMMPYTEILFPPGSRYSYSNPGLIFLGRVIEKLSGDDYEVYVEKNILRPLGMNHSYFDRTPYHLLRFRSNNYTLENGAPKAGGLDFDTGITVSNGGLNAPLTDMVKYLRFLLGTSGLSQDAQAVLARSSLAEMWRPVLPVEQGDSLTTSIGLSFFIVQMGATRIIGHTGSQNSFNSLFYIQPETGSAIIAIFNTAPGDEAGTKPNLGRLFQGVVARYMNAVLPSLGGRR